MGRPRSGHRSAGVRHPGELPVSTAPKPTATDRPRTSGTSKHRSRANSGRRRGAKSTVVGPGRHREPASPPRPPSRRRRRLHHAARRHTDDAAAAPAAGLPPPDAAPAAPPRAVLPGRAIAPGPPAATGSAARSAAVRGRDPRPSRPRRPAEPDVAIAPPRAAPGRAQRPRDRLASPRCALLLLIVEAAWSSCRASTTAATPAPPRRSGSSTHHAQRDARADRRPQRDRAGLHLRCAGHHRRPAQVPASIGPTTPRSWRRCSGCRRRGRARPGRAGPYAVLATALSPVTAQQVENLGLAGIYTQATTQRQYPGQHNRGQHGRPRALRRRQGPPASRRSTTTCWRARTAASPTPTTVKGTCNPSSATPCDSARQRRHGQADHRPEPAVHRAAATWTWPSPVGREGRDDGRARRERPARCWRWPRRAPTTRPTRTRSTRSAGRPAGDVGIRAGVGQKAITIAAALREGHDQAERRDQGASLAPHGRRARSAMRGDHPAERFTATGVLAESSNVGTLKIAQKLGPTDWMHYEKEFGVGTEDRDRAARRELAATSRPGRPGRHRRSPTCRSVRARA